MSEPFIAEIRIFAGNFAPRGWALCDGQTLPIAQNTALFSILGTTYGGDGRTTLGLPDLRGRHPIHPGNGAGLTPRRLGERLGSASVVLSTAEIPSHDHAMQASAEATTGTPSNAVALGTPGSNTYGPATDLAALDPETLGSTGGSQAHSNLQPYLAMTFIIAVQGLFPSRS